MRGHPEGRPSLQAGQKQNSCSLPPSTSPDHLRKQQRTEPITALPVLPSWRWSNSSHLPIPAPSCLARVLLPHQPLRAAAAPGHGRWPTLLKKGQCSTEPRLGGLYCSGPHPDHPHTPGRRGGGHRPLQKELLSRQRAVPGRWSAFHGLLMAEGLPGLRTGSGQPCWQM